MERRFNYSPDNSELDMFAFDYGTAILLRNPDGSQWIMVSTGEESKEYRRLGWKSEGSINRADFGNT